MQLCAASEMAGILVHRKYVRKGKRVGSYCYQVWVLANYGNFGDHKHSVDGTTKLIVLHAVVYVNFQAIL